MHHYLAMIDLVDAETDGFLALVPRQRKYVDTLMGEGKIVHYALAADHSRLWTTILAESEEHALDTIRAFPLVKFMRFELRELAFHLQGGRNLMHVSLN
jgi:hypothetical protein